MIQKIKRLFPIFMFALFFNNMGFGQSKMRLNPYKVNNSHLETIVDTIMTAVKTREYIDIKANKINEDEYVLYASFHSPAFLTYNPDIIGYTIINNTIIYFYSNTLELIKRDDSMKVADFRCRPPKTKNPTPKDNYLDLKGNDCGLEWTFLIRGNCVKMLRGVKNGEVFWDMEGLRELYFGNGQNEAK